MIYSQNFLQISQDIVSSTNSQYQMFDFFSTLRKDVKQIVLPVSSDTAPRDKYESMLDSASDPDVSTLLQCLVEQIRYTGKKENIQI